jgi:hypothetical protein
MITKPKARKAPAKAARKTRAKPAPGMNSIEVLIARWKWLEADQDYRMAVANDGNGDSSHDVEQEMIIAKLREMGPGDYSELEALFRFALDEITGEAPRNDGASADMLKNVSRALFYVVNSERETARLQGMTNMRSFLNKRSTAAFDVASDSECIKRIAWGNA